MYVHLRVVHSITLCCLLLYTCSIIATMTADRLDLASQNNWCHVDHAPIYTLTGFLRTGQCACLLPLIYERWKVGETHTL